MLMMAMTVGMVLVGLATALTLWRLAVGPSVPDRILALDTLAIDVIALVVLMGLHSGTAMFLEAALLIAMTGFVGTVALCKYMLGRSIVD
jgi:multicomponent K+:H+ antiporter subunit F